MKIMKTRHKQHMKQNSPNTLDMPSRSAIRTWIECSSLWGFHCTHQSDLETFWSPQTRTPSWSRPQGRRLRYEFESAESPPSSATRWDRCPPRSRAHTKWNWPVAPSHTWRHPLCGKLGKNTQPKWIGWLSSSLRICTAVSSGRDEGSNRAGSLCWII